MPEILTIDLKKQIARKGDLEFLRAETSAKYRTPFVLVRYALMGAEQKEGLRLDLDKRAFLDHLEDSSLEAAVAKEAQTIASLVGNYLHRRNPNSEKRLSADEAPPPAPLPESTESLTS